MGKKQEYGIGEYLDYLRDSSVPHTVDYTRKTKVVKSFEGREIFSDGSFNNLSMNMIRSVKTSTVKRLNEFKHLNVDYEDLGLRLFTYNESLIDFPEETYSNVIEIDLNKAYWVAAHKLGILSSEIFKKGLAGLDSKKLTKVHLLACLGGFAMIKKRKTYVPDTDDYITETIDDSSATRFLWNAISWEVDKCMQEIKDALGLDFYFYWTDAVFIENTQTNVLKVSEIIKKHGFESKEVKIEYIDVKVEPNKNFPDKNIVNIDVWTKAKKSHAKTPKRNKDGFYSRVFRFEDSDKKQLYKDLEEHVNRLKKNKNKL